jgi:hypothetical protein
LFNQNDVHVGKVFVRTGGRVGIENLDLALASQLGVVNPASIAWELIPFSFIVDWFLNVGDFLNQFSDFLGLRIEDDYTSHHYDLVRHMQTIRSGKLHEDAYVWKATKRVMGHLTGPSLSFSLPNPGWRKAVTAISLLLQQRLR